MMYFAGVSDRVRQGAELLLSPLVTECAIADITKS